MTTRADQALAVPVREYFAGQDWELSPLTLGDIGRITEFIRSKVISLAKDTIKDDSSLDRETKILILDRAYEAAERIDLFGGGKKSPEPEPKKAKAKKGKKKTKKKAKAKKKAEPEVESDDQMTRLLNRPDIMGFIIWLSLKHLHEVTVTEVDEMFTLNDQEQLTNVVIRVFEISGFITERIDDDDDDGKKGGPDDDGGKGF